MKVLCALRGQCIYAWSYDARELEVIVFSVGSKSPRGSDWPTSKPIETAQSMSTGIKKFKLTYTDKKTGQTVQSEEPRLMISADGATKSLWVGESTILASVPRGVSDSELWQIARSAVATAY